MAECNLVFDRVGTPIGEAVIACDEAGRLRLLDWSDCHERSEALLARWYPGAERKLARDPFGFSTMLAAYMEGEIGRIDTVAVALAGSVFQTQVWQALRAIPAGHTRRYGELANTIAAPQAARAVGAACGANPVSIVVPCHRAVGAGGRLIGYAGGLSRKRWLLAHETRWTAVMAN